MTTSLRPPSDSVRPMPTPRYRRVVHPVTGRFLFEFDAARWLVLVVDRGQQAWIDLTEYVEPIAEQE